MTMDLPPPTCSALAAERFVAGGNRPATARPPVAVRALLSTVLLLALALSGAPATASEVDVDSAFGAGDWNTVAAYLNEQAKAGDGMTPQRWFQLGFARFRLGQWEEALSALTQARPDDAASAGPPGVNLTRLHAAEAASHGQLGRYRKALASLELAVEAGLPPGVLTAQNAFDPLRDRPRFAELVQRAEELAYPCRSQPESRQLDFWAGTWSVSVNGAVVGTNEISVRHEGCVLFEDYTAGAYTGQSFSYWDPASGSWRQLWIDNRGVVTHYEGRLIDGSMVLEGINQGRSGEPTKLRMTFTPNDDGTVRQRIEQWDEEEKEWGPSFDGIYTRSGER